MHNLFKPNKGILVTFYVFVSLRFYDRVSDVERPPTVKVRSLPTTVICTPPPTPLLNPPVDVVTPVNIQPGSVALTCVESTWLVIRP